MADKARILLKDDEGLLELDARVTGTLDDVTTVEPTDPADPHSWLTMRFQAQLESQLDDAADWDEVYGWADDYISAEVSTIVDKLWSIYKERQQVE